MLKLLVRLLGGSNDKKIKEAMPVVDHINALEPEFENLTDVSGLFKQINESRGLVWATMNHSSAPILSAAYGPQADEFTGVYHNTDILPRFKQALGWSEK